MLNSDFKSVLTEEERAAAIALRLALEPLRSVNPHMPLSHIVTFLEVAIDEGQGVAEYAKKLEISPTVMTPNLLDVGDRNRMKEPGLGLITQERDILDLRRHNAKVTPKGKGVLHKVLMSFKMRKAGDGNRSVGQDRG